MKIMHIVGARPQFVKLAALARALNGKCEQLIVHTGQHYDAAMSESFFNDMDIPIPDFNLAVGSGLQGFQTAKMMEGLESLMLEQSPDAVVVYGDTNSTLAAALVASKLLIRSIHVEACLRSFNRSMPEEINRIVSDHVCDLLLCPTQTAMQNAALEGLQPKSHLVGDIMVDSVLFGVQKAAGKSTVMEELKLNGEQYYLLTLHRPYNVDDPKSLDRILSGLDSLGIRIVFPVHPRTAKIIKEQLQNTWENVVLVPPQSYLDFMMLHQNAMMMITDSGGVQKEAYLLSKPCVTLRTETEWVETVEAGWNLLLPPESADFPALIKNFKVPEEHPDLYGKDVGARMAELILK